MEFETTVPDDNILNSKRKLFDTYKQTNPLPQEKNPSQLKVKAAPVKLSNGHQSKVGQNCFGELMTSGDIIENKLGLKHAFSYM